MSDIARYYVAENNPEGAMFAGVPLRDLTEEEYRALPEWLRTSIDASPLYSTTKPKAPKALPEAEG